MSGPEIGYDAAGLRRAAERYGEVSTGCAGLVRLLGEIPVVAAVFGDVPAVAGFCAALTTVRDDQARGAGAEAGRRAELSDRAARTAADADRLTSDTTAIAAGAAPIVARG